VDVITNGEPRQRPSRIEHLIREGNYRFLPALPFRRDGGAAKSSFISRTRPSLFHLPRNSTVWMNTFDESALAVNSTPWRDARSEQSLPWVAIFTETEVKRLAANLLGLLMNSLAMEHHRAPLPVSARLVNASARCFRPEKLDVLKEILRRYLFSLDERLAAHEIEREAAASQADNSFVQPFANAGGPRATPHN
jgi:hypothetical protein